jgi:hypothetical protein
MACTLQVVWDERLVACNFGAPPGGVEPLDVLTRR